MPFSESNLLVLTPDWISRCTVLKGKEKKKRGFCAWDGEATLKNLPEAWRRWKLLQASDEGCGGEAVLAAGPGKGERW